MEFTVIGTLVFFKQGLPTIDPTIILNLIQPQAVSMVSLGYAGRLSIQLSRIGPSQHQEVESKVPLFRRSPGALAYRNQHNYRNGSQFYRNGPMGTFVCFLILGRSFADHYISSTLYTVVFCIMSLQINV